MNHGGPFGEEVQKKGVLHIHHLVVDLGVSPPPVCDANTAMQRMRLDHGVISMTMTMIADSSCSTKLWSDIEVSA